VERKLQVEPIRLQVLREGDLNAACQLAETIKDAALFLYSDDRHLFADSSLRDYEESVATLLKQRVRRFLDTDG